MTGAGIKPFLIPFVLSTQVTWKTTFELCYVSYKRQPKNLTGYFSYKYLKALSHHNSVFIRQGVRFKGGTEYAFM